MKKIFYIIILITLFNTTNVFADTFNIDMNFNKKSVVKNEKLNLSLVFDNLVETGLSTGQFYINYEQDYYSFSCNDISYHQGVSSSEVDCRDDNGKIIILYVDDDGGLSPIKDGEFITLNFLVKTNTSIETSFKLSGEGFSSLIEDEIVNQEFNDSISKTVNIVEKQIEPEDEPEDEPEVIQKNTDSYLKSLEVKGYDIKFNKNIFEYFLEVENNIDEINISATSNAKTSKVSGTGKKKLYIGDNEFKIIVTAENGNKRNYIINITRKEKEEVSLPEDTDEYKEDSKTDTVENPKTGNNSFIIISILCLVIISILVVKFFKGNCFPKV